MALSDADAHAIFDRRRRAWLVEDVGAYLDCWVDDLVLSPAMAKQTGHVSTTYTAARRDGSWAAATLFPGGHVAAVVVFPELEVEFEAAFLVEEREEREERA